jgi:hypothetical protein
MSGLQGEYGRRGCAWTSRLRKNAVCIQPHPRQQPTFPGVTIQMMTLLTADYKTLQPQLGLKGGDAFPKAAGLAKKSSNSQGQFWQSSRYFLLAGNLLPLFNKIISKTLVN